jgi:uncharacterized protein (TIGR03000 family)
MLGRASPLFPAAFIAAALFLWTAGPVSAQRGGHAGGGHAGGGHAAGSFHGGGTAFHGGGTAFRGGSTAFHGGSTWHGGNYWHGGSYHHHNYGYYPALFGFGIGYGYYPWVSNPYYYSRPYYNYPDYYAYTPSPIVTQSYYAPRLPLDYGADYVPPAAAPRTDNTALVRVQVPPGAEIWFDGEKTQQTGAFREFVSPPLAPGSNFVYQIKARWAQDGRTVEQTRDVTVRANVVTDVDFTQPAPVK